MAVPRFFSVITMVFIRGEISQMMVGRRFRLHMIFGGSLKSLGYFTRKTVAFIEKTKGQDKIEDRDSGIGNLRQRRKNYGKNSGNHQI